MVGERHSVKSRHRLTLRARSNDGDHLTGVTSDLGNIDKHSLGNVHISEADRRADNVYHAASRNGDLASELNA